MSSAKETVERLLALADVEVGGKRPFDIQVRDERFYKRVLAHRELGFGESYMDGWWDAKQLDQLIARVLEADLLHKVKMSPGLAKSVLQAKLTNQQTLGKAKYNASYHYDIGNDLYERMLGERMIYSCGYWRTAKTLGEAQEAKLKLICDKLHLKKGMTLLEIGCGWGGFAEFAAKNYGVKITGITLSKEQLKLAKQRVKGLPVKLVLCDYREVTGKFDRVVSIAMMEAVGPKNLHTFFMKCKDLLNHGGLMLHHTIGNSGSLPYDADPWTKKYIFPGGALPSLAQISRAVEGQLIIEDVHNFGPDYDPTLMAWHKNFVKHYPEIKDKYDERFYRMWNFYLLSCAGAFRARYDQLWQIVMRKVEASDVYEAVR